MAGRKLTEAQLAEKDLLDTVRTAVRLKHRIQMRHELNELEADALAAQREALSGGLPYKPDVAAILRGELSEATVEPDPEAVQDSPGAEHMTGSDETTRMTVMTHSQYGVPAHFHEDDEAVEVEL